MSFFSKLLVLLGLVSLFHAAYSAHEFSVHNQHLQRKSSLPLDIKIETILAVLSACVGLVLGTEPLKPISWRTWAGKIEEEGGGSNPYRGLEERMGFLDIRAKRKEFADWVRERDTIVKS